MKQIYTRPLIQHERNSRNVINKLYGHMEQTEFAVEAWACDVPRNIMSQKYKETDDCRNHVETPKDAQPVTVTILHREKRRRHQGYSCAVTETLFTSYCGMHSHSSVLLNLNYFNVPKEITKRECQAMMNGKYRDEMGTMHDINNQGITVLKFYKAGKINHDMSCEGQSIVIKGRSYNNVVATVQLIIEVRDKEIMYIPENRVLMSTNDNVKLQCSEQDEVCMTSVATYIWTVQTISRCMLAKLNTFHDYLT